MSVKGITFVVLSAICSGVLPIFVKMGYNLNLTLEIMLAMRFFIAAVILTGFILLTGRLNFSKIRSRLPGLILLGLFYFGGAVCYMAAARYLPASIVSILFYLFPTVVVLIMTFIYGEAFSLNRLVAIALTFLGCLFIINIFSQKLELNWLGLLIGVGSAICFAIYNVRGQSITRDIEPIVVTAIVMIVCSLSVIITTPTSNIFKEGLTLNQWLIGFGMAIISSAISPLCYLKGIALLGASRASIVSTVEPAFTIAMAWMFLGERLSIVQFLGGLCILTGILIQNTEKVSKNKKTLIGKA